MSPVSRFLFPNTGLPVLRRAAILSLTGALVAGLFGIVHDQITYTISPEYFTRMKFDQFKAWDFGHPRRVFVAEIGLLATWWVGLIAGWFLARIALSKFQSPEMRVMSAMAVMILITAFFGFIGGLVGPSIYENQFGWRQSLHGIGVTDVTSFSRVAGIHLGGYGGAFIGWIAMMVRFVKCRGDR